MKEDKKENYAYPKVTSWVREYGNSGDDSRGIADFVECETSEAVRGLQAELRGISEGRYQQDSLDKTVSPKRRMKHLSYDEWAKAMLRWLAARSKAS